MPCADSSSSLAFRITHDDILIDYEYGKITCGKDISTGKTYREYCQGKKLTDILTITYPEAVKALEMTAEEDLFILHLEWDVLRSAIAIYLGIDHPDIDHQRCVVSGIEYSEEEIEIAEVVYPPREMPKKILPCSLTTHNESTSE